jgi:hypothetical protein
MAMHQLPVTPRFSAVANWVHGGHAIALTNKNGAKLFLTPQRFSSPTHPLSVSCASSTLTSSVTSSRLHTVVDHSG